MKGISMTDSELVAAALEARERAYAPYSQFTVGAALLCSDGSVYGGCNVENAAHAPGTCAERPAFLRAVFDGHRDFTAIAIVGGPAGKPPTALCAPCGVCRQVMMEFAPDLTVICLNKKGESRKFALKELLPYGFDQSWL